MCLLTACTLPSPLASARLNLAAAPASPAISEILINPPGNGLGVYDKFEVQFKVRTTATQLDLPFDAKPPPGVLPGTGISVDGLFSRDNWATTVVQPAFLYQAYTHTLRPAGNELLDHRVPNGGPRWMVRFAPQQAGIWMFKLRATDAGGSSIVNAGSFTVAGPSRNLNRQRGFLRVSQTDRRYFEFQDGSPFIGVGFNSAFDDSAEAGRRLQTYAQNKINLLRVWLSGAGINGSHWTSWAYHGASVNYLPATHLDVDTTFNGADVSLRLDREVPCLFTDFWQGRVPVQPNTAYSVSARVRMEGVEGVEGVEDVEGVEGVENAGGGFAVKQGGWLDETCTDPAVGNVIIQPRSGSTGWITLTGTYQNGNADWLGYLYLALQNSGKQKNIQGQVFVDEVRMWRQDDPDRVNILREPNANSHEYFDPLNAAVWDDIVTSAEKTGVYLKLVIDEKNEWIRNHLGPDGQMIRPADMAASEDTSNNDNFYAAPNTKVRWLMQAWWRYLIARWGYSTAIHSFELLNEGDPYNGQHYDLANAFARYMHQNDPARHMVTTSFWHSFPGSEFWAASEMDYADLHAYISTGWGKTASFLDATHLETRPQHVRSGTSAARIAGNNRDAIELGPRGLTLRGKGTWTIRYWMKASNLTATCGYGTTGSQVRLRWRIDGGSFSGGHEGIVPPQAEGKDFVCTSPGGSFAWQQFSSEIDTHGQPVNSQYQLMLNDDQAHAFSLSLENSNGIGGTAWVDDVQIVSPDGRVARVVGEFDTTPMDEDTAWYNRAYGEVHGAQSLLGANMPLVRGEAGLDKNGQFDPDLLRDVDGVWLHNNVWGQVNAGGMLDLFWWASETIDRFHGRYAPLYNIFAAYRSFMADVPLNNGQYVDAGAQTSSAQLRAWGQRDDVNGRMHLWVQNTEHTWKRVVAGQSIKPVTGTITLANAPGTYTVTWWDTRSAAGRMIATQQAVANSRNELVLQLPSLLANDVGLKLLRNSKMK